MSAWRSVLTAWLGGACCSFAALIVARTNEDANSGRVHAGDGSRRLMPEPSESELSDPAPPVTESSSQATAAVPPTAGIEEGTVHLVTQRVDSASLLIDNDDTWVTIKKGLLVYVSFRQGANREAAVRAAKTLLNLPLCTLSGQWGDGSSAESYLRVCSQQAEAAAPLLELLVVPQAALSGRLGRNNRGITYKDQVEKEVGRRLYDEFIAMLRKLVDDITAPAPSATEQAAENAAQFQAKQAKAHEAALQPPELLFRTASYSKWDSRGIPTHDASGTEVSKNAKKKLEKRMKTAVTKYKRAINCCIPAAGAAAAAAKDKPAPKRQSEEKDTDISKGPTSSCANDDGSVVKCGTFGNRQGLRVAATGGPFCHTMKL